MRARSKLARTFRALASYSAPMDYGASKIVLRINSDMDLQRLQSCRKEPETVAWLEREVTPGSIFYDVGANVGAYSLIAAKRGASHVYAFEPSYSSFKTLSENIITNNVQESVTPICVGVGETNKMGNLMFSDTASGAAKHSWMTGDYFDTSRTRLSAPVMTLDEIITTFSLPLPTMLKIDVDGCELGVVEGAYRTLLTPGLTSVLVEIDERESGTEKILKMLTDASFVLAEKHPREKGKSKVLFNCIFTKAVHGNR